MSATTTTALPDMIGWNARKPTVEECELVGRDTFYATVHGLSVPDALCRLPVLPLQAGGRWFEPGTAHSQSPAHGGRRGGTRTSRRQTLGGMELLESRRAAVRRIRRARSPPRRCVFACQ
jgi:hypothetical protein